MYITLKRESVLGFAISREKTTKATTISLLFLCWIIQFEIRNKHTA
jgi:hypothetical protein